MTSFITQDWSEVKIFNTPTSLRDHISKGVRDEVIYCILAEPLFSLFEGVEEIQLLKQKKPGAKWIVGDFDLRLNEGPLVVLFKDGDLLTACLDKLDILALLDQGVVIIHTL